MRSGKVRPLYTELAGAERFALEFAAATRNDDAEAEHLWKGCPFVQVELPDPDYGRAHDRAMMLAARLAMPAHRYLGWLDLLEALEERITLGFGGEPAPEHTASHATLRLYRGVSSVAASHLRSLLDALEEVCRTRMGTDGVVILANYDPKISEGLGRHMAAIVAEAPDPEQIGTYVAYLEVPFTMPDETRPHEAIDRARNKKELARAIS